MVGKKTKGKQKIDIKKVEKKENRMITFSKRRNGIYNKLSEISILCGADAGFLIYSGTGKPFTFSNSSFDVVAERFLQGNHHTGSITSSSVIVDAHKKVKMDAQCKKINGLVEEAEVEEEKLKMAQAAYAPSLPVRSGAWWKADPKDEEEAKQFLRRFEDFHGKLCTAAAARSRGRYDGLASTSFSRYG